jgi:hypothetical protein
MSVTHNGSAYLHASAAHRSPPSRHTTTTCESVPTLNVVHQTWLRFLTPPVRDLRAGPEVRPQQRVISAWQIVTETYNTDGCSQGRAVHWTEVAAPAPAVIAVWVRVGVADGEGGHTLRINWVNPTLSDQREEDQTGHDEPQSTPWSSSREKVRDAPLKPRTRLAGDPIVSNAGVVANGS